jgi:hypothetical protein
MVRIKHIAIRTPEPEKTSAFYRDVFGLKEVGPGENGLLPLGCSLRNKPIIKKKADALLQEFTRNLRSAL